MSTDRVVGVQSKLSRGWIMRWFTFLVVVVIGFAGAGYTGCTKAEAEKAEQTRRAIQRVYLADKELSKSVKSLPPGATPSQVAWAIGLYCDELDKLDMSDCPPDFRVAYRHHIGAWREFRAAITKLPDGFLSGMWAGAMNALMRGEADGGLARLEGELKATQTRVRDTWIEVEKIGAGYGVVQ